MGGWEARVDGEEEADEPVGLAVTKRPVTVGALLKARGDRVERLVGRDLAAVARTAGCEHCGVARSDGKEPHAPPRSKLAVRGRDPTP